jgi:hypothetical protein
MPIQTAIDSISNSQGSPFGFKNRIINGAMVIDQRNAGAAFGTSINGYSLDRWILGQQQSPGKLNGGQNYNSITPPSGFSNYLGVQSQSAYSVGSSDYYAFFQYIEGFNTADLAWGTASAATVTLSFWVRSSLTGTFGGSLRNGSANRSYPFTYTISSANTWEQKSITVAGDTTGTWATNNTTGIGLFLGLGVGSSLSGTAGAWTGANLLSATGATSVVGTNGATFYITGVQLEKGTQATAFDYRPYGYELSLCQRYFQVIAADNGNPIPAGWHFDSSSSIVGDFQLLQVMRAKPTLAQTATSYRVNSLSLNQTATTTMNLGADETSLFAVRMSVGGFSGGTAPQPATFRIFLSAANSYVALSAEL